MPAVWISRPAARAMPLAQALTQKGIEPLMVPAMLINEVAGDDSLPRYLAAADIFAVSIFVSREAARRVAARLPQGNGLPVLPALAVGEKTADALSPRYHLLSKADAINDSEHLLQSEELQQHQGRVAVLGGTDEDDTPPSPALLAALRERGNEVTPVVCYRRLPAEADAALSQRGEAGEVHAAVAYSGDSLRYMLRMTAPNNAWLKKLPLFVIHDNIADTARALGFNDVMCASNETMAPLMAHRLNMAYS